MPTLSPKIYPTRLLNLANTSDSGQLQIYATGVLLAGS